MANEPERPSETYGYQRDPETQPLTNWRRSWCRLQRDPLGIAALIVVLLLVVAASIGPLLYRVPYDLADFEAIRQPPSSQHLLGTDGLGRDVLARLLTGTRVSLIVALTSQVLALVLGAIVGVVAGFWGRTADTLLMRAVDVFMAVPGLLLILILLPLFNGALLGGETTWLSGLNEQSGGSIGLILAMALSSWLVTSRLVRGQVLSLREQDYVQAARSIGASRVRIVWKDLLPNLSAVLLVSLTLTIPAAVLAETGVSFLGLGIVPPMPSLGSLISEGAAAMRSTPTLLLIPVTVMAALVVSLNTLGDSMRDAIDPKSNTQ